MVGRVQCQRNTRRFNSVFINSTNGFVTSLDRSLDPFLFFSSPPDISITHAIVKQPGSWWRTSSSEYLAEGPWDIDGSLGLSTLMLRHDLAYVSLVSRKQSFNGGILWFDETVEKRVVLCCRVPLQLQLWDLEELTFPKKFSLVTQQTLDNRLIEFKQSKEPGTLHHR